MQLRTDLALELAETIDQAGGGISVSEYDKGGAKISRIKLTSDDSTRSIGKPKGTYITITVPPFSDDAELGDELLMAVKDEFTSLLPKEGLILVVGIGNTSVTPDALGPKAAAGILATRHISGELARSAGLENLRPVAVLSPGVLGQTGIETGDIIAGIVKNIEPAAVIAIDALASRKLSRLGCTIQIADSGINPGAGVGNKRREISLSTLGVPVISVGVPTVVDATTLVFDLLGEDGARQNKELIEPRGAGMMVTPREIDILIERAARLVSRAVNCALQPGIPPEDLLVLAG